MRDKQRIRGRMAEEGAVFAERLRTNEAREALNATLRKFDHRKAVR
jgi:hypothetical protein